MNFDKNYFEKQKFTEDSLNKYLKLSSNNQDIQNKIKLLQQLVREKTK